jgi:hypothetical protein
MVVRILFNIASTPSVLIKKHASDLTPYPLELVPFKPVDGADT